MALRIVDLDVRAAVTLGPVQRRVRVPEEAPPVVARQRIRGDAGREGVRPPERRLGGEGGGEHPPDHGMGVVSVRMGKDQCELVAADAEGTIGGTAGVDRSLPIDASSSSPPAWPCSSLTRLRSSRSRMASATWWS